MLLGSSGRAVLSCLTELPLNTGHWSVTVFCSAQPGSREDTESSFQNLVSCLCRQRHRHTLDMKAIPKIKQLPPIYSTLFCPNSKAALNISSKKNAVPSCIAIGLFQKTITDFFTQNLCCRHLFLEHYAFFSRRFHVRRAIGGRHL